MQARFICLAAGLALWTLHADAETYRPEAGERFPEIALPSIEDGQPLSIRDFRGRKLIVHVWASW